MPRATQADIEHIFGPRNVRTWADLENNDNDAHILSRISRALTNADEFITNRIGDLYPTFTAPYPLELVEKTARYAGVLLYESRGIDDASEGETGLSRIAQNRKQVLRWLQAVRSGVFDLVPLSRSQ